MLVRRINEGSKEIGDRLKVMSIDQVQTEFNVPKDQWYTPAERELIQKELDWVNNV